MDTRSLTKSDDCIVLCVCLFVSMLHSTYLMFKDTFCITPSIVLRPHTIKRDLEATTFFVL